MCFICGHCLDPRTARCFSDRATRLVAWFGLRVGGSPWWTDDGYATQSPGCRMPRASSGNCLSRQWTQRREDPGTRVIGVLEQALVVAAGGGGVGVPDRVLNVLQWAPGLPGEGHKRVP